MADTPGPRACPVCDVRLQACWPFREDDQHCALCGLRILRLAVLPTAPDGHAWLYREPEQGPLVRLVWERGLDARPDRRQAVHPLVDFSRSSAHFGGERLTGLDFSLAEVPAADGPPAAVTARLLPRFRGFDRLDLPPRGVPGHLVIASALGTETHAARLLPPGQPPILDSPDPSVVQREGGIWQAYQQEATAVVPLHLTVPVAQWLVGVTPNSEPDTQNLVTLHGLAVPLLLEPGRAYPFELHVNAAGWGPFAARAFTFVLHRAALGPYPLTGRLALVPGSRLHFGGGSPRTVEVRLGRRVPVSLPLAVIDTPAPPAREAAPQPSSAESSFDLILDSASDLVVPVNTSLANTSLTLVETRDRVEAGITITDYVVRQGPPGEANGAEWLRVTKPRREHLPWHLSAQTPDQLDLEVDTTQLDRERYTGAVLRGAVELIDSRHRRWVCEVQANVGRPPRLASFVAIDWGTTNSCAAYRKSITQDEAPLSVSFDEEQRQAPELFPSDMYFEDLSDPHHPVFLLGHDAARRAREHPECCLRSVKRKFQFLDRVFVMDERQRGHTYPTAELARLLLRQLIALAENTLGQEIHNLGLTFPTKWSARVRARLEEATRRLAADLTQERRPFAVTILPPTIDEANAVAINLIASEHGREDLPETFRLIAYDFGGGTVDTSVLEVYLPQDTTAVQTRYIGLGGRGDFGGDEVTRAVMTLLRDRVADALQRRVVVLDPVTHRSARLLGIPLVADGEPLRTGGQGAAHLYQLGRKNWDALWKIAELIKMDLCDTGVRPAGTSPRPQHGVPTDDGAPPLTLSDFSLAAAVEEEEQLHLQRQGDDRHPVVERLRPRLAEIDCRVLVQPGHGEAAVAREEIWTLDRALDPLDADTRDAFFKELHFTLDEACDFPLEDIFETNAGQRYTVRERVEDTVRELRVQCDDHGIAPDIIVLAGGGCRLPLVARLMRDYFPSDRDLLHYDPTFAKRQVAHGMASYLTLRQVIDLDHQLARSVDVTHHPLGLQRLVLEKRVARTEFQTVVPVGAPLHDPSAAHRTRFAPAQLLTAPEGGRRLTLFVRDWRRGPLEFGHFDVSRPPAPGAPPLPVVPGTAYEGEVRLHGPGRIELTVTHEGGQYGPFVLTLAVPDPEATLQSEDPLGAGGPPRV